MQIVYSAELDNSNEKDETYHGMFLSHWSKLAA